MRSTRWIVCAVLAASSARCAPPHNARTLFAARPAPTPETLTIAVASDLRWPVRTHAVLLALDGTRVTANAPLRVPAGRHTVDIRAELRWSCAVAGSEAIAYVTHERTFETGARGAELRIAILSRGTVFDIPERRFELRTVLVGDARHLSAEDELQACAALSEIEAAVCRLRSLVRESRERRDIIEFSCENPKLQELESIALAAASAPLTAQQRARIEALERESHECNGARPAMTVPIVELVHPCEGDAEESSTKR